MSTHASIADFTKSETNKDGAKTLWFLILLINSLNDDSSLNDVNQWLNLPHHNYSYPMQIVCSKASHSNPSKLFPCLHCLLSTHYYP